MLLLLLLLSIPKLHPTALWRNRLFFVGGGSPLSPHETTVFGRDDVPAVPATVFGRAFSMRECHILFLEDPED
jgi:hypothetical protein